ncbi:MAG: sigma-70 family RNA polymerase sigma factor [Puia sp.]
MPQNALPNENDLFHQIADGNESAFTTIYNFYADTVFNMAMVYTKDEPDAEEVVQLIFLRLWEYRAQLKEVRSLRNYLFISTRNKVFDQLRIRSRSRRALSGLQDQLAAKGACDATADWMQQREYGQLLEEAVSGLTPQQKIVYTLAEQQAYSFDDIAQELKLSKSTVKKHMELARKYVRAYVSKNLHPDLLLVVLLMLAAEYSAFSA